MLAAEILFWVSVFIIIYSYIGYGVFLIIVSKIPFLKKLLPKPANAIPFELVPPESEEYFPFVTLIISASGESKRIIREKIQNTYELEYPKEKLEIIFAIAYDTSGEVDETLSEFYGEFLTDPDFKNLTIADEELYFRFSHLDSVDDPRHPKVLDKLEKDLEKANINSDNITEGSKQVLDDKFHHSGAPELAVRITKDIERKGKISQVNRTVKIAEGEILVFSDCNSMFNKESILNLSRHFRNKQVGCVAGEKRVLKSPDSTSGEGEGLYWKYESILKKIDSDVWSAVGAAGEIFAIRKELWSDTIEDNAIIEDFVVSMRVAQKGYRVIYEPEAYAEEEPTSSLKDEFVRRRRIAAGGFQSIVWLKSLLNIFKFRVLTFQYISHRVLRWAVVPFLLPLVLIMNVLILVSNFSIIYSVTLAGQVLIYFLALVGFYLETKKKKMKLFYLPFVIMMMNWAAYVGLKRYYKGQQKVVWERAKRS